MNTKVNTEREIKNQAIEDIMSLLEIVQQIDNCDLLGRGTEFKAIILKRLEQEINKI